MLLQDTIISLTTNVSLTSCNTLNLIISSRPQESIPKSLSYRIPPSRLSLMNHEEVLLSLIGLILYCVEVNIPFTYFVVNIYFNFFSVSFLAQLVARVRGSQRWCAVVMPIYLQSKSAPKGYDGICHCYFRFWHGFAEDFEYILQPSLNLVYAVWSLEFINLINLYVMPRASF